MGRVTRPLLVLLAVGLCHLAASDGAQTGGRGQAQPPPAQAVQRQNGAVQRKYLLAYCLQGRLSNQMHCMRTYLMLAQALGRTLLVPTYSAAYRWGTQSAELDYKFRWDTAVDWGRMRRCLSPSPSPGAGEDLGAAAVTLEEYLALEGESAATVGFWSCAFPYDWAQDRQCYGPDLTGDAFRRLHDGVLRGLPNKTQVQESRRCLQHDPTPADFRRHFGNRTEKVICFGEMFGVWIANGTEAAPRAEECKGEDMWQPHPAVRQLAQGIRSHVIGPEPYWAVHLRRGDFYEWLSASGSNGRQYVRKMFPPMVDAALWLRETLQRENASKLFIATDSRPHELALLRSLLQSPVGPTSGNINLYSLRDILKKGHWLRQQPWAADALKLEEQNGNGGIVFILVDMLLCAAADRFVPSLASTFSSSIVRIREVSKKWNGPLLEVHRATSN